jgi:hypothetical protein
MVPTLLWWLQGRSIGQTSPLFHASVLEGTDCALQVEVPIEKSL